MAGLVDWAGNAPPTATDAGGYIFDQGLTGISAIAATGKTILGNVSLPIDFKVAPNFRDHTVGTVHTVWGLNMLPRIVEEHLAGGR